MKSILYLIAFALAELVSADQSIGLCCICPHCGPPVNGRGNMNVDQYGTTCYEAILNAADPTKTPQGSNRCYAMKTNYYNRCCNPYFNPPTIQQAPTVSPISKYPKGPYSNCNLCHDGGKPDKPNTVTSTLQIPGTPTCMDLYYMGLTGNIPSQICNPLQDAYDRPCGCRHTYRRLAGSEESGDSESDFSYTMTTFFNSSSISGYPDEETVAGGEKSDSKVNSASTEDKSSTSRSVGVRGGSSTEEVEQ